MIHEASSDQGSVVPDKAFAAIIGLDDSITILMPTLEDNDPVPPLWVFLTMVLARAQDDPEWMLEIMEECQRLSDSI